MRHYPAALNLLACALLASCASSTMDSIPTGEKMQIYKNQAQREFAPEFARLSEMREARQLSEEQYFEQYAILEDRVVQRAHTLAWDQHHLAEMERKAQGVPTPDAPMMNMPPNAMMGGAGGQSAYRPAQQQFNAALGVGGSNMLNPSLFDTGTGSQGGAMSRQNFPGSVYDEPTINQ